MPASAFYHQNRAGRGAATAAAELLPRTTGFSSGATAECMGCTELEAPESVANGLAPGHRPFIQFHLCQYFLFLLCSGLMFHMLPLCMFRELCKRLALRDVGHQKNCNEKQSLKVVCCRLVVQGMQWGYGKN